MTRREPTLISADRVMDALQQIRKDKYNVPEELLEDKKSKEYENLTEFNDRIDKLRTFIQSSLQVFDR